MQTVFIHLLAASQILRRSLATACAKQIDWDVLVNGNNSAMIPVSSAAISFDSASMRLGFLIDLEYLGASKDGKLVSDYELGLCL